MKKFMPKNLTTQRKRRFLERHKLSKLAQEEADDQNSCISIK